MNEKLRAFDLETHLIQPGLLAPPVVCASFADKTSQELVVGQAAFEAAQVTLSDRSVTTCGANIAYDLGCLAAYRPHTIPVIFEAFAEGRIFDVQIAQALDAIARGTLFCDPQTKAPMRGKSGRPARYSLDVCVKQVLGRSDAKANDLWRTRYALLEAEPLDNWPAEAKQYPIDDAVNTYEVALSQTKTHLNLSDLPAQVETAFALHLGAIWGIRTSRARVEALRAKVDEWHKQFRQRFEDVGFLRADGTENTLMLKRATAKAYGAEGICAQCAGVGTVGKKKSEACRGEKVKGRYRGCTGSMCDVCKGAGQVMKTLPGTTSCEACSGSGFDLRTCPSIPRSDKGGIKVDRDTLSESGDDLLEEYSNNEPAKIRETYLPFLEQGLDRPINLRPNVLVESGRTSYDGLIQLIPRSGGVRECFEARPGYVYCDVDYAAVELCTLAQACIWTVGGSVMAETINRMRDPGALHTEFAAQMVGCSFEDLKARIKAKDEVAKNFRQAAKAANFGFGGAMGAATFVLSKRKKSEGSTTAPSGKTYTGLRFCILTGGKRECGVEKVMEWKQRALSAPICRACVEEVEHNLRPAWFKKWPEVREYHDWVKYLLDVSDKRVPCLGPWCSEPGAMQNWPKLSHRIRGGVEGLSAAANNGFQALAADGAKAALRALVRECYLDASSPLWGTRPIMFVHDACFSEMPEHKAHLAGPKKAEIMIREMRKWVPDVHIAAEPALMRYWDKRAEPTYKDGKLVVWEAP